MRTQQILLTSVAELANILANSGGNQLTPTPVPLKNRRRLRLKALPTPAIRRTDFGKYHANLNCIMTTFSFILVKDN